MNEIARQWWPRIVLHFSILQESKNVCAFGGLSNEKKSAEIKTKMLIYLSKDNLDRKILFGKIAHVRDPKIGKMFVRGLYGNREFDE